MTDETELAALRARIEELERKANPPEPPKFEGPRGPTTEEIAMSRASLSREAMEKMNIPGVGDIFRDRVPQNLAPLGDAGVRPRLPQGPREPTPLGVPGGQRTQDLIGKLLDVDDARGRAQLIADEARRLASAKK
jgi:hypothetical protein